MREAGLITSLHICTGFLGRFDRDFEPARRAISHCDTAFRPLVHQFHCSIREDCIAACCKDLLAASVQQPKTLSTRHRCN